MKRSWLKEDKSPSKLIVNFSSKINGYIKDVSDLNQNNVEALSQWSDYIEGIKSYLSNPVIAWDNMNRYPRLRNGGRVIKDFDYNAGYTILADYVRTNYKYAYHLAPKIFEESIKQKGLIPSNNNSEFKYYEPRVYVMKGGISQNAMQELIDELYQQAKQRGYANLSPEYSLFQIDLSKIDDNVRFYGDINEAEGLFITSVIKPNAFVNISTITAQEN